MASVVIAIDTNLLVYAHRRGTVEHAAARAAMEQAAESPKGWGIALPAVSEFWSVVTHARCMPRPSTGDEARAFLDALIASGGGQVWVPGPGFWERLLRMAAALKVNGPRIFDLQIALMAFEGGASELWSHDTAFVSVPGLAVHDPLR